MKIAMIIILSITFTLSIFLIAKFGTKRKESQEYVNQNLNDSI